MKFYKVKHLPTGLYLKPKTYPYTDNLGPVGKWYKSKPSLKSFESGIKYNDMNVTLRKEDFELETYTLQLEGITSL